MASNTLASCIVAIAALIAPVFVSPEIARAQVPEPPIKVTAIEGKLALHSTVVVEVQNISEYLMQLDRDAGKFTLYLDWRRLNGVSGRRIPGSNRLLFDIRRTPESKAEWDALLGRPLSGGKGFTHQVSVSVGYADEPPVPTEVDHGNKYPLVIVNKTGFLFFVGLLVASVWAFMWLARNRDIIRDPCPRLPTTKKPFSLGRTQMAFWFFMVAASYVFIWMITGDRESITDSALGLLGISAATAVGAQLVASSKSSAAEARRESLEVEQAALAARLPRLETRMTESPPDFSVLREGAEAKARKTQVESELGTLSAEAMCQNSEGFLLDILSDVNGISLHRFQMAVWTGVLGVVFAASVYSSLSMPQFSGTLLALLGISGGTYIGFKFPERQA